MIVWPGKPHPLGATWDGNGTNFAIYSENATEVELCLFNTSSDVTPHTCVRLVERTAHVWHAYLPGVGPGTLYGYRVNGPYEPSRGLRFNPFKLLVDPYAKALAGAVDYSHRPFGYVVEDPWNDSRMDDIDSAPGVPKGVVLDPAFDWRGDARPETPWHKTVIYEAHVKGLTRLHPEVPEAIRGTYAALAHPAVIRHLKSLGITAVELLPIHEISDEPFLDQRGLRNYWGYSTLNFFSPAARYSSAGDAGAQVREFKEMVRALHAEGLEVILDVVYNHTAEGNHLGPTLSLRGIDNPTYYRLSPEDPRYYVDFTGTGNSLNTQHPQTLKLIMDSLRYWIQEMHVDGFRFDLASTLAREAHEVDRLSAFFDIIHQDPVISQVKLIAEPWDVGPGGYQVGNFPVLWAEWNGKYRDAVRSFWRGEPGTVAELGYRLTGSSDLFEWGGRRPHSSINFVTAHDGFTLNDLVSYCHKHNEANGEGNRDGENHNLSCNFGVEGSTLNPDVIRQRERQKRNLLTTLILSQGVPMLCAGDEMGRTQKGNNNAYCQDNEISWIDWDLDREDKSLLQFVKRLSQIRLDNPVFRRRDFFQGRKVRGSVLEDITWFSPDGVPMTSEQWTSPFTRCFGMRLGGEAVLGISEQGEPIRGDTFLLVFNSGAEAVDFTLPLYTPPVRWSVVLDTDAPSIEENVRGARSGETIRVAERSILLLRRNGG